MTGHVLDVRKLVTLLKIVGKREKKALRKKKVIVIIFQSPDTGPETALRSEKTKPMEA